MRDDTPDVFLSHSVADHDTATALCAGLERLGLRCWIAPRDVEGGAVWARDITAAIRAAPTFVVLLSEASVASAYVRSELTLATNVRARIVPIRVADVVLPDEFVLLLAATYVDDGRGGVEALAAPVARAAREAHDARREQAALGPRFRGGGEAAPGGAARVATGRLTQARRAPGAVRRRTRLLVAAGGAVALALGLRLSHEIRAPAGGVGALGGPVAVHTPEGFTMRAIAPGGWAPVDAAPADLIALRRDDGLRFLSGIQRTDDRSTEAVARRVLDRVAMELPAVVVPRTPVRVGDMEWDVPLGAAGSTSAGTTSRASSAAGGTLGVLRLQRVPIVGRDVVRWWLVAGALPGLTARHRDEVTALVRSLEVQAAEARQ